MTREREILINFLLIISAMNTVGGGVTYFQWNVGTYPVSLINLHEEKIKEMS